MSDNNFTKLSLSLLPIEDIAKYLNIAMDFVTKQDKASDVEKVAGVPAEKIAVAVDPADRETVKNALNLGGVPASGYMTTSQGNKIDNATTQVKNTYGKEISDLRDEVYQLQQQLYKSGIIAQAGPYSGFQDMFNVSHIVNENDVLATAIDDSITTNEIMIDDKDFDKFDVGDYIALVLNDVAKHYVVQIIDKEADGMTLKFSPDVTDTIKKDFAVIYKSLGTIEDGSYNFYKKEKMLPDSIEMFSTLDDDTFRLRKQIDGDNAGYAWSFRIPESQKGFLTKLGITIKTYGTPGALMCYIIDERNQNLWKNPVQAESDKILLAKSQPLTLDASYGEKIVNFNFYDGTTYPLLNEADTVDHKVRYVAIITATEADSNNYYDLLFLQNKRDDGTFGDLQLNNLTYEYIEQKTSSQNSPFTTNNTINSMDVYYSICTRGVINHNFTPYREAIYSSKFKTYEPVEISNARVMLRIAREGYFTTDNVKEMTYQNNGSMAIKKDPSLGNAYNYDMSIINGVGVYKNTTNVAIGNEIRKITGQNSSSVILEKGMYLDDLNKPIYRVGYKVYLKAWLKEWDEVNCKLVTKDYMKIELPLSFIMPDRIKKIATSSDRLVFENVYIDDTGSTRFFNNFELQIHWETEYGGFYEDTGYKEDLVGRIHDLVVSLDRGI